MINWGDIYSLSIEKIDEEHRVFFTIVEEAEKLLDIPDANIYKEILQVIESIQSFMKSHFESEEKLMAEIQYPEREEHKMEHTVFLGQVTDIDLNVIKANEGQYLLRTLDFLVQWFILHMSEFDKKMAKYYHEVYKKQI